MKRLLLSLALIAATLGLNAQVELMAPPKLLEAADITLVSCTGNAQTRQVVINLTLNPRNFMLNANISGGWEGRAYDAVGTQHKLRRVIPSGTLHQSNIPQGIPCTFQFGIEGVDPKTPMLKSVVLPFHVSADGFLAHSGNSAPIEFRNVPIAWEKPEGKTFIRIPFEMMGVIDFQIVSCTGDKANGLVTLELTTTCNLGGETRMALGASREDKAFDNAGNVYEVTTQRMQIDRAPQNTPLKYTMNITMPSDTKEIKVLRIDYYYTNDQSDWACRRHDDTGMIELHNLQIEWR